MPEIYASPEAKRLHSDVTVFDCLSLSYLLDPPYVEYALEGGVSGTNLTVASEGESWDDVLRAIDVAHTKIARNPDLMLATTATDVRRAKREGKLAVILGTQGSEVVDKELSRVGILCRLGVRFIGLAYTGATLLADGCGERRDAGLTFLGQDFVNLVNELPLMLDLSHTGHRSRLEAAQMATHPVCTHSNAYTINPNDRNTRDEVARIIADKGGVLGVTGLVRAVAPKDSSIEHMLDHASHWVALAGQDNTGLGLDFTEGFQAAFKSGKASVKPPKWRILRPDIFGTPEEYYSQTYPAGLETIRQLPNFTDGLIRRGFDEAAIRQIMGGAWLRKISDVVGS